MSRTIRIFIDWFIESLVYFCAGPFFGLRINAAAVRSGAFPWPLDRPHAHVDGPDPRRIIILGDAVAVGVGVTSHRVAITGQLARFLARASQRGIDVDAVGRPSTTARGSARQAKRLGMDGYDGIVLLSGGVASNTLTPPSVWRHDLVSLLESVSDAAPGVPVVFPSIGHIPASMGLPRWMTVAAAKTTNSMNVVSTEVCELFEHVTFIPPQAMPESDGGFLAGYADAANAIGTILDAQMDRRGGHARSLGTFDESRRQRSLDDLSILTDSEDDRFDHLLGRARELLLAGGAAISFIDRDREFVKAASGLPLHDISRTGSFCDTTIRGTGAFEVSDAADSAFSELPWVTGASRVRSYLGQPLTSPSGARVGGLCVVDMVPREFSELDKLILADLTRQVQKLLWHTHHVPGDALTDPARRAA